VEFAHFKNRMLKTFGLDLDSYKEAQLQRRIDSFLARHKVADYQALYFLLQKDPKVYGTFIDCVTINVSEFFRDPARWVELEKEILPGLLARRRSLKVWSAACANGAEPYSLAIVLKEAAQRFSHYLLATDIDQNVLAAAQAGRYNADVVRHAGVGRLGRYFIQEGKEHVIKEEIKKLVSFRQHDLLTQPFEKGFDLILCRNVTIYFTRDAQQRLNYKFTQALAEGGILFVGGSEMIFNYKELGLEKVRTSFYRKTGVLKEEG